MTTHERLINIYIVELLLYKPHSFETGLVEPVIPWFFLTFS
ncbi:MAG TPA: hypothetical protein V6C90_18695 [Coleofasciculaceae cyanobacterium]